MQQHCCLPLQQRGALSLTDPPGPRTQALGGFDTLENLEIPLVDQSRDTACWKPVYTETVVHSCAASW